MKRGLNIYQAAFVALAFGKLGSIGAMAAVSWWLIVLVLVIGSIAGWIDRLMHDNGFYEGARISIANMYLEGVRKRATNKAIKAHKQELRKAANQPLNKASIHIDREL